MDARRLGNDLATECALMQGTQVPAVSPEHVLRLLVVTVVAVAAIAHGKRQAGWYYLSLFAGDDPPARRFPLVVVVVVGLGPPLLIVSQPLSQHRSAV